MAKRDYYEVLGVTKTATEAEVKRAYRQLAVQHHPDQNPDDPHAEEKFKAAAEASADVWDVHKQAAYDRFGHQGVGSGAGGFGFDPGFTNIEDIFDIFGFGDMFGRRAGPPKTGHRPCSVTRTFATTSRSRSRMKRAERMKSSASRGLKNATTVAAPEPKK